MFRGFDPGKNLRLWALRVYTSIEYESIVAFGRLSIIEDRSEKARFFDALMSKYSVRDSTRPTSFYPRLDGVTVYSLAVERVTGKAQRLPPPEALWPARHNTMSPHAKLPT